MKNYIDLPCPLENTSPKNFLEHLLQRLYSVDVPDYCQNARILWTGLHNDN